MNFPDCLSAEGVREEVGSLLLNDFCEGWVARRYPSRYGSIQFRQMPCKKMVGAGNDRDRGLLLQGCGKLLDYCMQYVWRAMGIEFSARQQLWLVARVEVRKVAVAHASHGKSKADRFLHARIAAGHAQTYPGAKTETGEQQRRGRILRSQKVERRGNVAVFSASVVVLPFACAHPAKIEAQHGHSESVQRFCGLVDNFVMHGAAVQRMRVAYHRGDGRSGFVIFSSRPIKGLDMPDWTLK